MLGETHRPQNLIQVILAEEGLSGYFDLIQPKVIYSCFSLLPGEKQVFFICLSISYFKEVILVKKRNFSIYISYDCFTGFFSNELVVYIYESLSWIEEGTIQKFEEINNCKVRVVKLGDSGNVLTRLILEKKNPRADVVIGLDQALTLKAKEENLLIPYKPNNINKIKDPSLIMDQDYYVVPFDYGGAIAIIYDPEKKYRTN